MNRAEAQKKLSDAVSADRDKVGHAKFLEDIKRATQDLEQAKDPSEPLVWTSGTMNGTQLTKHIMELEDRFRRLLIKLTIDI